MNEINNILQKIRKSNALIEEIDRMEKSGIEDVSISTGQGMGRYALDLSELGIGKEYVAELLSPILTAKLAEQKKNLKAAIVELSKQLQELAGGAE